MTSPHVLSADEVATLASCGRAVTLPSGATLFERGQEADSMYLLSAGSVLLHLREDRQPRRLEAGEFLGELALLHSGHRRTGRADAGPEGCALVEIGPREVAALLERAPSVLVDLLRHSCLSLLGSEQGLVAELRARNEELERTLDWLRRTREELDASELRSLSDPLTGIYNRRCLELRLGAMIGRAEGSGTGLALLLLDLDKFKHVNDTWGHPSGDRVLRAMAAALRRAVRSSDLPCRIGGDEFAVILAELPEVGAAEARAAGIFRSTGRLTAEAENGEQIVFTSTHGGALYRSGEGWESLQARADRSLYLAKEAGRHALAFNERLIETG